MSNKAKKAVACSERRGNVGGQAVIEGVMMRGKKQYTTAVRTPDGKIIRDTHSNKSVKDKVKFLKLPILRGVVNFVEMLMLSMSTLTFSAEAMGLDTDQEESKFEKWLTKTFGSSLMKIATVIGAILGILLAVGLFMWLPAVLSKFTGRLIPADTNLVAMNVLRSIIEGFIKIGLFVLYIYAVSFMPDIRRTFEYHGAEHKSIFCYENGLDLTVENVKKQKRQHPRCGTSFMIVIMVIGVIISSFLSWDNVLIRTILKLCTLPLVVGLGYEFLMYAGKHDNIVIKILSAPGMWLQNITTREPDSSQIEVAIVALKSALPDVFSEENVFENITIPDEAEAFSKDNTPQ